MILPHTRLLVLVGVTILPPATIAPFVAGMDAVAVATFLLVVAVAALDAVLSLPRLAGLQASLPAVTRMTQDVAGILPVMLQQGPGGVTVRFALNVPASLGSVSDVLETTLDIAGTGPLDWPCHPTRRGRFELHNAQCELGSRLKLWNLRARLNLAAEVRVYPNLREERKRVASRFLHRGTLGTHAVRRIGKGRSFEQLRDYVYGDSYEDIHWRATAKRRHPVTKVYEVERTQEIYVVLDTSRQSGRAAETHPTISGDTPTSTLLERYISTALILKQIAQQQGDLFGLIGFSDRVLRFARARTGLGHYNACVESLYTLEPQQVSPDFEELFTFIRLRLRKRALLIVLTDLDNPVRMDSFTQHVGLISHQHVVLVNTITAVGVEPLFGPTPVDSTHQVYRQLARHLQWERLKELETILHRQNVGFHQLSSIEACSQVVEQYILVKQRQLL